MTDPASISAHVDTFCRDNLPPADQWPTLELTLPELQYPARLNCATALLDDVIAAHGPDRPCVTGAGEQWTYGDLLRHANQVAHVLTADLGLVPGGRVLLHGPNTPWLVACWFAVLKAGGVVVTTMPLLRAAEIQKLVDRTRAGIALCDASLATEMGAVTGTDTVYFGGQEADDLVSRAAGKPGTFQDVVTAADDVAMLAPTSGTTGVPKATMQFHRDVLAVADTFSRHVVQPTAEDVFTGTPPLAFTFGLGGLLIFPMRVGASVVLLDKPGPEAIAEAVDEHGATVLSTSPTMYRSMVRNGWAPTLRGVRRGISAGEHLPAAVWHEVCEQTGLELIDGIGATEMMHVFISAPPGEIRPGSTGRAVPGYRAAILDERGEPVPDGEPGRLAVIGPTGCRYLDDPRQRDYVHDGWNITGDTYVRDEDGYFWYQARSDDMIISSGYNIAAPTVEEALDQHPDVLECAVVGLPDTERGALVHAAVVLREGSIGDDTKRREIQDFVKQTIAPHQYPRSLEFREALPRTATGKLQRYRLREEPGAIG